MLELRCCKKKLDFKRKDWIKNLALEAETAITLLPNHEQDYIRLQVAHNVKQLYKQYGNTGQCSNPNTERERTILSKIKAKLASNKAVILKADKGNSIVFAYTNDYNNKVQHFIGNRNFTVMDKDPTKHFQRIMRNIVNESPVSIDKHNKTKYINLNPTAPSIRGLPKLHKVNCPIRPIVNRQNAPAFKIAKLLNKLIQTHISHYSTFST
jgi:hypothetical protein